MVYFAVQNPAEDGVYSARMGDTPRICRSTARPVSVLGLALTFVLAAGTTPAADGLRLVEAARNQDWKAVRALLDQRADATARAHDGATALHWAAHWNHLDAADLLIRAGANVNATNDFRMTPLSLACTNRSAALVGRLLKAGAS